MCGTLPWTKKCSRTSITSRADIAFVNASSGKPCMLSLYRGVIMRMSISAFPDSTFKRGAAPIPPPHPKVTHPHAPTGASPRSASYNTALPPLTRTRKDLGRCPHEAEASGVVGSGGGDGEAIRDAAVAGLGGPAAAP